MKKTRMGLGAIAVVGTAALVLTGCASGGDSGDSGSGDSSAIITTNGNEPQNPLIPSNTTETGGGKIIDSIFEGLVSTTPRASPDRRGRDDRVRRQPALDHHAQGRPDLHRRHPGHGRVVHEGLELGRSGLQRPERLATSSTTSRATTPRPTATSSLKVVERHRVHGRAVRARRRLPAPPRLLGLLAAARVVLRRHRRVR